jgi:hypothetical protein
MNYVYVPAEFACPGSIWQLTRGVRGPLSEVCIKRYLLKIRFWDTTRTDDVAECSERGHERGHAQLTRDTWRPESVLAWLPPNSVVSSSPSDAVVRRSWWAIGPKRVLR